MISSILTIYLLGLATLFVSYFLGQTLFRFRKTNLFLELFLGYLFIISIYAIGKANFNSIGIVVLLWLLGYFILTKNQKNNPLINKKELFNNLLIVSVLWTVIFILKASYFWNSEYDSPNLLFVDYECYMRIAEGYNLSGHENALEFKNVLLPYLNFAQPYRASDFWLVSIGLDLTKIDTIYIWELFYSTISLFLCSLSFFVIAKKKYNLLGSLVLSILILFAFCGPWYSKIIKIFFDFNSGGMDPIGIAAYTKLALVFSIVFQFFYKYEKEQKMEAAYYLLLIPILIQSTIAFFIVVFLMILYFVINDIIETKSIQFSLKKHLSLILIFILLFLSVFVFYKINHYKEQLYIGNSNQDIISNDSVLAFIIQFFKKLTVMFISYYWLSFIIVCALLLLTKSLSKKIRFELLVTLLICYLSTIFLFAKYNKIENSYQFSSNVFGPFILALIIYLLIQTPIKKNLGKLKISFLVVVSLVGLYQLVGGSNVFHSVGRIYYYDKNFINQVKTILPKLNYPFGLIYYGESLQDHSREDFPQHDAAFLKLFGRNYNVFTIEADSLKKELVNTALQKRNVNIDLNALNIWLKNKNREQIGSKSKFTRKDFYNTYPFSFCLSKKPKDSLPDFIKEDVVSILRDQSSKVYFYTLDRK